MSIPHREKGETFHRYKTLRTPLFSMLMAPFTHKTSVSCPRHICMLGSGICLLPNKAEGGGHDQARLIVFGSSPAKPPTSLSSVPRTEQTEQCGCRSQSRQALSPGPNFVFSHFYINIGTVTKQGDLRINGTLIPCPTPSIKPNYLFHYIGLLISNQQFLSLEQKYPSFKQYVMQSKQNWAPKQILSCKIYGSSFVPRTPGPQSQQLSTLCSGAGPT